MDSKEFTKLIFAFTLGDGFITRKGSTNAAYKLNQLSTHKEYVEWQASILEKKTRVHIKIVPAHNDGYNHKEQLRLSTMSHPFYTTMHDRVYFRGRKTVSAHDLKLLDFQCMAVWYMDDGYISRSNNRTNGDMALCTDNFSYPEVVMLQKAIYEKLEIPFNIRRRPNKSGLVYRLVCTRKNTEKLITGIKQYVFPSFEYKIHTNSISS